MQGLPSFLRGGSVSELLASFYAKKEFSPVLDCLHNIHPKRSINVYVKTEMTISRGVEGSTDESNELVHQRRARNIISSKLFSKKHCELTWNVLRTFTPAVPVNQDLVR